MFDLDTIEEHGDSEIKLPCEKPADDALINSNLPAQHCYSKYPGSNALSTVVQITLVKYLAKHMFVFHSSYSYRINWI